MTTERALEIPLDASDSNLHSHAHVKGKLTPLRTRAEVQASSETTPVYVVEIPSRSANAVLGVLRNVIPPEVVLSLQHLRRFARAQYLPAHLICPTKSTETDAARSAGEPSTSHLLVSPVTAIPLAELKALFHEHKELLNPGEPLIHEIPVPVFAPTSAVQAAEWSSKYWPTIYKNTNPYGPHPSMVRRAELELMAEGKADEYMDLAGKVARECEQGGHGMGIGAVIVERGSGAVKGTKVVAVAGDARFRGLLPESSSAVDTASSSQGNAMGHAVLRAIAMIADKRLALEELQRNEEASPKQRGAPAFANSPLTPLETHYAAISDNLTGGGYLCLDLELHLTHEPCIMCAMAILHSRFGRVVFGQTMPNTGALSAEVGTLGYGLFWREQLNWKYLCWQWEKAESEGILNAKLSDYTHA